MPTVIGLIFFCCAAYFFLFKEEALLGLLIVACVFEAASAMNFGERGIQPYYLVAIFIILRAIANKFLGLKNRKVPSSFKWLVLFECIAVASALIAPIIFAGIPIYDPKIGIDAGFLIRPPLHLGLNNFVQASFLTVHVAVAFSLLALKFSPEKTRRAFLTAFYIEITFIFAEALCQIVGIAFPLTLVLNNPGYAVWTNSMEGYGTRNPGTFSEPSFAGAFLVLYCIAFMAEYFAGRQGIFRTILGMLSSALVASTSSIVVLGVAPIALMIRYSPFRFPWYVNLRRTKKIVWISCLILGPLIAVLFLSAGYREMLSAATVSKGDTGSFINRTTSDLYGLHLAIATHGLGVGLGSSRSSSMISTVLSNIGVAGTLSFGIFYFRLFKNVAKSQSWLRWGALAYLANVCIGLPDITMPVFWIPIFLAVVFVSHDHSIIKVNKQAPVLACDMA